MIFLSLDFFDKASRLQLNSLIILGDADELFMNRVSTNIGSNGFKWLNPQKSHTFLTNPSDVFEMRTGDKELKLSLKIVPSVKGEKDDL